jgi:hypothetical protein
MGTNYYHESVPCERCGHSVTTHIGKSSLGWTFTFHGTGEIRSWTDWLECLAMGGVIRVSDGDVVSLADFVIMVRTKRACSHNHARDVGGGGENWLDAQGNSFSAGEFS